MRVQPRQQILDIWLGTIDESYRDKKWIWGGRDGSNSISDAEQLLSVIGPATRVPNLAVDEPDRTSDDVLEALSALGGSVDIPVVLIDAVSEYIARYTADDGTPIFSGEGYFSTQDGSAPTPEQRAMHVVDSFAVSVTLSLATIGFLRKFRAVVRREELLDRLGALETQVSSRLTAAMIGLLRSFTITVFSPDSRDGVALRRMVDQTGLRQSRIVGELREALREVSAGLRDLTIGSGAGLADELARSDRLFECGWSWGLVQDAPEVEVDPRENIGKQPTGVAQSAPYMYFTVVAMDGIAELFSDRTQLLQLLNDDQQRLAQALRIRWNLTQSYWSIVASFGGNRWPLEDIPWQRPVERESDYFSLLVSSVVVLDLVRRRASDADLNRVGEVLAELAQRSRITRRWYAGDTAIEVHAPGVKQQLNGNYEAADGAKLVWIMSDFSPALMKRSIMVASLLSDIALRERMLTLVDDIWGHVAKRTLSRRRGALWDEPAQVYPTNVRFDQPSWYYTKRVVDCLVEAAEVISSPPVRSPLLRTELAALLTEANHIYDSELLRGPVSAGPAMRQKLQSLRAKLDRARSLGSTRPGSAVALAQEILLELDRLAAARDDVDAAF
jgi:hypothetical protein